MQNDALIQALLASKPTSVVLLGEPMFRLEAPLRNTCDAADVVSLNIICASTFDESIESLKRENLSANEAALCMRLSSDVDSPQSHLGRSCRAFTKLVIVEHANSQKTKVLLSDEQFFAFGFRKMAGEPETQAEQRSWYAYSLRDYKQPPDWLNARFWAHPERFNLPD